MSPNASIPNPVDDRVEDFQSLLQKARAGDAVACERLYHLYGEHVLRAVRDRLSGKVRSLFDSSDFTQQVWKSFFVNILPRQQFESPAQLLAFLEGTSRNKVLKAHRDQLDTRKRCRSREVPLETCSVDHSAVPNQSIDPHARIDDEEELEFILKLVSQRERLFLERLVAGESLVGLAQHLAVSIKTLRRVAVRIMEKRRNCKER